MHKFRFNRLTLAAMAALSCLAPASFSSESPKLETPRITVQDALKVEANLKTDAKVGKNSLEIRLTQDGKPVDAKVRVSVEMSNMDMGTSHPSVERTAAGIYVVSPEFTMSGPWTVVVEGERDGQKFARRFEFEVGSGGAGPAMGAMSGKFGSWSMQKEGSGTSWLPESSPMFMKALPKSGRFDLDAMGFFTLNGDDAGGKRGDSRFYSNSMLMLMGQRQTGGGIYGFSVMASLDPIFNGRFGYPDLFQTGETAYGQTLTDYQHPHDLAAEVAVSYSHPLAKNLGGFVYLAPVGEPALGAPVFMHRPSGMEIPEAPISHHWLDSTHIAWGVATVGLNTANWQLEGSAFNGHEPDENRYSPDPIRLNSASTRIIFNPTRDLSISASYGFLDSPESTEPGVHQHRLTASAIWNRPLADGNLATTLAFGRNIIEGRHSDAVLAEATLMKRKTSFFARWEHVTKNELNNVPAGNYMVNKFLVGSVHNVAERDGLVVGIGGYIGFYIYPKSLYAFYGRNPITFGVFLRLRPTQMGHDMH